MEFIIKDKELAQLLNTSNNKNVDSTCIHVTDGDTHIIMALEYSSYIRFHIVNKDIPKEVLDKVKTLLTLDVKRHDAFKLVLPYLIKDK